MTEENVLKIITTTARKKGIYFSDIVITELERRIILKILVALRSVRYGTLQIIKNGNQRPVDVIISNRVRFNLDKDEDGG